VIPVIFNFIPSIICVLRGSRGRDRMVVGFKKLPIQSVPVTNKRCEFEPGHGMVYSIQYYVIKFVSDLRQVGEFLWVLPFPPSIKLTATI
jgi:hypothetical protein